jgi:hypothetical protein
MSKRRERPWDKGCHFQEHLARAEAVLAVPSVEVDGVTYKSDRFYLNTTTSVDDGNGTENGNKSTSNCTCGSQQPPPLFDREKLVQSLDLKAAILGTFTTDLNWMAKTFPQLVGPTSTVPTLILHGHKGLMKRLNPVEEEEILLPDSEEQENSEPTITATLEFRLPVPVFSHPTKDDGSISMDGGESLKTQEDPVSSPGWNVSDTPPQRQPLHECYTPDSQNPVESQMIKAPKNTAEPFSTLFTAEPLSTLFFAGRVLSLDPNLVGLEAKRNLSRSDA